MTATPLTIRGRAPTCGTFSKGVDGSVAVSYCTSGGRFCDCSCRHHPQSTAADPTFACYAVNVENDPRRKALLAKMARHDLIRPDHITGRAVDELQARRNPPPWLRISTGGSLPPDPGPAMAKQWRRMADYIVENDMLDRHHIPVETAHKAAQYRALDRRLTIRESAQTWHRWIHGRGAMSTVAGKPGTTFVERIKAARAAAAARREATGRPCGVCPAVVQGFRIKTWSAGKVGAEKRGVAWTKPRPQAAHCGQCKLCSLKDFDTVFPCHA